MMNPREVFTYALRQGAEISVHENGFLIVPWPVNASRIHLFSPMVPRQKRPSPIHSHRWDMHSIVLAGKLVNRTFFADTLRKDTVYDTEKLYEEYSCGSGVLLLTGRKYFVAAEKREELQAGQAYNVAAGDLHASEGVAVTFMTRGPVTLHDAVVVIPEGQEPDNDFRRDAFSQDYLLDLAHRVISDAVSLYP